MSTYTPDRWMLVRIEGSDPHYRVFGSWYGGYLDGDSWRMNSGITRHEEGDNFYYFHGSSGSIYRCHKKAYGATGFGMGVLADMQSEPKYKLTILREMPDISQLEW